MDQENGNFYKTDGWKTYTQGITEGYLIGGNINSFYLLQGTEYMPSLKDKILMFEFCSDVFKEASIHEFDRNLESLIQNDNFNEVKGLIIGRFQISSNITEEMILAVLDQKPILRKFPVVYDFDIGHTTPMLTLPIGGKVKLNTEEKSLYVYNGIF